VKHLLRLLAYGLCLTLAGILFAGIRFATVRADEAKTRATVELLCDGMEKFKSERLFYPRGDGDVKFYRDAHKRLRIVIGDKDFDFFSKQTDKDYMQLNSIDATSKANAEELLDAWDEPIKYRCPGGHNKTSYDIWSTGVSGPDDTSSSKDPLDDITNWNDLL
jgi:hypothetical protein